MSTPPPSMSAPASAPFPPEPAQPRLSEGARIIDSFIAPRKTFEDIRVNSSWWVPWLLATIVAVGFGAIAANKIDMTQFMRHQIEQSKARSAQFDQLSPAQQEQQLRVGAAFTKVIFYISPVFLLLIGLIVAAVLLAVFNFGFAAEVSFPQSLAIVFYSFLPRVIVALLLGVSLLVASDPNSIDIAGNPMPTNLAFFMDAQSSPKFLYSLLSYLDIFTLWPVCLMGLGFGAVSKNRKLTPTTAIAAVFALFLMYVMVVSAIRMAF